MFLLPFQRQQELFGSKRSNNAKCKGCTTNNSNVSECSSRLKHFYITFDIYHDTRLSSMFVSAQELYFLFSLYFFLLRHQSTIFVYIFTIMFNFIYDQNV